MKVRKSTIGFHWRHSRGVRGYRQHSTQRPAYREAGAEWAETDAESASYLKRLEGLLEWRNQGAPQ